MVEFFRRLFAADYVPHGTCYLWDPAVLWLNVISDGVIALSYYAIPFLLFSFARRRRDLSFQWIFVAFGMFILACGTTHLLGAFTVWVPAYRLDGVVKAITAVSSAATFMLLVPLLPTLVSLPSPTQLASANRALAKEIEERKAAQEEVQRMNTTLEQRIAERTAELRASNEELRESMERYRFLAEAMPQIVFTAVPDGRVDYYNQRWYEYSGMPFEETQGWGWEPALHPDDLEHCLESISRAVATGGAYQVEVRLRRASDGAYRWHLGRALPRRNHEGEVVQWVGTYTDIHDLKGATESLEQANHELRDEMGRRQSLEEQLLQAQKMEAIGRLAGGVAHDFNNLLTGISGFSGLLLDDLENQPRLAEYVREIESAASRAGSLTNQLLAFSRRQVAQPRVIDLNKVVEELRKMLVRLIGEDVQLVTRLAPGLAHVNIDPGQVDQILMNLAVNARDAMPDGGRLDIETANVELGSDLMGRHIGVPPGQYVMLAVSDTGTGMDPETRQRLFEPFFTTKEMGRGTGLGLSIVYGIVKQNAGDILVYSEPGHGTIFKIYLPATSAAVSPVPAPREAPAPAAGGTVLVVEDEEVVLKFASSVLERRGYTVIVAETPHKALEAAARHGGQIDLLLTDVVLPTMSGYELAGVLGSSRTGLKVLYMSGYPHSHISRQGLIGPATPYIQKPFTSKALGEKVAEVLGRT
jgi:PAS domain S-box-containing protein